MNRPDRPRRRRYWLLALLLLLVFAWWLWPNGKFARARQLQGELFSPAAKGLNPDERRAMFDELRTTTRSLSDAQRRELSAEMMKRRQADLEAYRKLSPAEKKKKLDQDI